MNGLTVTGHIDDQHRLTAAVPDTFPPGPVTVRISPVSEEDDAGDAWMTGVDHEWADDLNDPRQDIYTMDDGEPIGDA